MKVLEILDIFFEFTNVASPLSNRPQKIYFEEKKTFFFGFLKLEESPLTLRKTEDFFTNCYLPLVRENKIKKFKNIFVSKTFSWS